MAPHLKIKNFDDLVLWIFDILILLSNLVFFSIFYGILKSTAFEEDYCPGSRIFTVSKGSSLLMIIAFFLLGLSYGSLYYIWRKRTTDFDKMNQCISLLKITRLIQYLMNSFNFTCLTWAYLKPEEHVSCPELLRVIKGYLITFLCLGFPLLLYLFFLYVHKPKKEKLARKSKSSEYGSL